MKLSFTKAKKLTSRADKREVRKKAYIEFTRRIEGKVPGGVICRPTLGSYSRAGVEKMYRRGLIHRANNKQPNTPPRDAAGSPSKSHSKSPSKSKSKSPSKSPARRPKRNRARPKRLTY